MVLEVTFHSVQKLLVSLNGIGKVEKLVTVVLIKSNFKSTAKGCVPVSTIHCCNTFEA